MKRLLFRSAPNRARGLAGVSAGASLFQGAIVGEARRRGVMRWGARLGLLLLAPALWCSSVRGEALAAPVQSASGQFSVLQPDAGRRASRSVPLMAEAGLLRVEPTLLAVSAERLRQHLTRELGDTSPWQHRVVFSLHRTLSFEAPVEMVAEWRGNGWLYRVAMPEYIAHDRFVRALVEVNLMEMANRTSAGRAVEIPAWLTEGLTARLLVSRSIELILPPPQLAYGPLHVTPWVVEEIKYQPLALARAQLRTNTPLSFEQLSWPAPSAFRGQRGDVYRHCSHVLLDRLLQLPDGHASMNAFIRALGQHYNWQVAFLSAYQNDFSSLLDVEKWWALQVAHFTGRSIDATYSYEASLQHLYNAIHCPVQVRFVTNDLPMHLEASLQTVIREWEGNQQRKALEQVLTALNLLRSRIAPELVELLDDYRLAVDDYLRNRDRTGIYLPRGGNRQAAMIQLLARTVRRLDRHDAELMALMPREAAGSAWTAGGGPP